MGAKVSVLGAGIVGICSALELQRQGHEVTLIDRELPQGTAYGSAGVVSLASILPFASPAVWRHVHRYLLNLEQEVNLHYQQLFKMLPYVLRFLNNTRPSRFNKNISSLHNILKSSSEDHKKLIDEAGCRAYLLEHGALRAYRSEKSFEIYRYERDILHDYGVDIEILDGQGIQELEPGLKPIFVGGVWSRSSCSITNPGALCRAYARLFENRGGRVLHQDVRDLSFTDDHWRVHCVDHTLDVAHVVVALGAWSRRLLQQQGCRLPLIAERGYHQIYRYPEDGTALSRPLLDADAAFVISPMEMGLRVTTGVEWAALDSPPTPKQLALVETSVEQAFPIGPKAEDDFWLGNRPETPDCLPIIGAVPGRQRLWVATGHGHLGLTMGPVTGRLISQLISGKAPEIDVRPYAPDRF